MWVPRKALRFILWYTSKLSGTLVEVGQKWLRRISTLPPPHSTQPPTPTPGSVHFGTTWTLVDSAAPFWRSSLTTHPVQSRSASNFSLRHQLSSTYSTNGISSYVSLPVVKIGTVQDWHYFIRHGRRVDFVTKSCMSPHTRGQQGPATETPTSGHIIIKVICGAGSNWFYLGMCAPSTKRVSLFSRETFYWVGNTGT